MSLTFLPESLVGRTGWLLIHSLWQFTLIAVVMMVILRMQRRSSATLRYGTH